jgi:hypothetical protein
MNETEGAGKIADLLISKAVLKQDVYATNREVFKIFKLKAEELIKQLSALVGPKDSRIRLIYEEKSDFEFHLHVAGDILVFLMHSNVFQIDPGHGLWKTTYLKKDPDRSYCGIINIYNFLHDSFRFNRMNDVGYLVARVFVNREHHYYVQGRVKQGMLHNDFINEVINDERVVSILETLVNYALEFDLYVPPYDNISEVSVEEVVSLSQAQQLKTGKRLGYKFSVEDQE